MALKLWLLENDGMKQNTKEGKEGEYQYHIAAVAAVVIGSRTGTTVRIPVDSEGKDLAVTSKAIFWPHVPRSGVMRWW